MFEKIRLRAALLFVLLGLFGGAGGGPRFRLVLGVGVTVKQNLGRGQPAVTVEDVSPEKENTAGNDVLHSTGSSSGGVSESLGGGASSPPGDAGTKPTADDSLEAASTQAVLESPTPERPAGAGSSERQSSSADEDAAENVLKPPNHKAVPEEPAASQQTAAAVEPPGTLPAPSETTTTTSDKGAGAAAPAHGASTPTQKITVLTTVGMGATGPRGSQTVVKAAAEAAARVAAEAEGASKRQTAAAAAAQVAAASSGVVSSTSASSSPDVIQTVQPSNGAGSQTGTRGESSVSGASNGGSAPSGTAPPGDSLPAAKVSVPTTPGDLPSNAGGAAASSTTGSTTSTVRVLLSDTIPVVGGASSTSGTEERAARTSTLGPYFPGKYGPRVEVLATSPAIDSQCLFSSLENWQLQLDLVGMELCEGFEVTALDLLHCHRRQCSVSAVLDYCVFSLAGPHSQELTLAAGTTRFLQPELEKQKVCSIPLPPYYRMFAIRPFGQMWFRRIARSAGERCMSLSDPSRLDVIHLLLDDPFSALVSAQRLLAPPEPPPIDRQTYNFQLGQCLAAETTAWRRGMCEGFPPPLLQQAGFCAPAAVEPQFAPSKLRAKKSEEELRRLVEEIKKRRRRTRPRSRATESLKGMCRRIQMFDKCDSHKAEYWTVVWMHLGPGMCEGVYGLSTPSSVEKEELFFQKSWLHMHRVQTRERLGQVFEDIERKKKEAEDAKKGVLTKLIGYVSGAAGGGGLSSSTSTTTTTSLTDLDEDSPEEPLVASEDQKVRREEQDDQSTLKEEDFQDPEYELTGAWFDDTVNAFAPMERPQDILKQVEAK